MLLHTKPQPRLPHHSCSHHHHHRRSWESPVRPEPTSRSTASTARFVLAQGAGEQAFLWESSTEYFFFFFFNYKLKIHKKNHNKKKKQKNNNNKKTETKQRHKTLVRLNTRVRRGGGILHPLPSTLGTSSRVAACGPRASPTAATGSLYGPQQQLPEN